MLVVSGTIVGFAAPGGGREFVRQGGRPLFPGEVPPLRKLHREREGLGLPRLGEDRSAFVTRQTRKRGHALGVGVDYARSR